MSRRRMVAAVAAVSMAVAGLIAFVIPVTGASAADCVTPWSSSTVYHGGGQASYNGHNWTARWWTQNETPGRAEVWADQGTCGGGSNPPPPPPSNCNFPAWVAGKQYYVGDIVRYTDGQFYITVHDNPGYDPVISHWFWDPYTCNGNNPPPPPPPNPGGFVVSEAQFNQMFPNRNPFYTYAGLTAALSAYPAFANTGSDTVKKQEAAAFLANAHHETGGLVHIVEQNQANYPHYCDWGQPYGCPAGQAAYYGRGPIQLSWNFNYKAAGDALGLNLLNDPWRVEREAAVAWKTALWYWNTQTGPGTMTPHNAMVNGHGFGQTIRSINGSLECDGKNPATVQNRINNYQRFVQILGVPAGGNLSC